MAGRYVAEIIIIVAPSIHWRRSVKMDSAESANSCSLAGEVASEAPRAHEVVSSEADAPAAEADSMRITIQFCSDMHLEMPLEPKRLALHLAQCAERCAGPLRRNATQLEAGENLLPAVAPYLALLGARSMLFRCTGLLFAVHGSRRCMLPSCLLEAILPCLCWLQGIFSTGRSCLMGHTAAGL
eukprot:SAG11_NODE_157_length_14147_cov_8.545202_8_plen_184_part_00